ncbi:hypothetical protein Tfer_2840 [Thermincola ferriacetica]|uniref:Uncharacterized protein n=1 Tax=Thermincola ferriacetica TaxID=281456 RepID=A0A0L6VZL8_9FIRM|nr:hypothetical protein [Thermincola ferriacetica]KNZ68588.1 hypothetical protein Tfer_2840 [Thermincola ferriacetica]
MGVHRDSNGQRETIKCANCFVCREGTEFCPKSDNYDPDAYLKLEEKLRVNREKRLKEQQDSEKRLKEG